MELLWCPYVRSSIGEVDTSDNDQASCRLEPHITKRAGEDKNPGYILYTCQKRLTSKLQHCLTLLK